MSGVVYSLVIPIYNEEETLPELHKRVTSLLGRLDDTSEVVLVDDGSRDASWSLIEGIAAQDPRFRALQFSRNFGHQIAITAGMDFAGGDAIIVMDADLQDPPEVIVEMAQHWRAGYDVVYAVREERSGDSAFKRYTASSFYRLFRRMTDIDVPADVGDFRLVDRRALEAFKVMRENNRYVRGMFSWIGFRQLGLPYERDPRYAGSTKYPLRKMLKFATDGIISFSDAPLRLALQAGFLVSGLSFVFGIAALVAKFAGFYRVSGLASLAVVTAFLGGMQLVVLGVMGEYVARIHDEVKDRPLYIVRSAIGYPGTDQRPLIGSSAAPPVVATHYDPQVLDENTV
jgi:polyisoprenyl-phosphate glycosyltransferase